MDEFDRTEGVGRQAESEIEPVSCTVKKKVFYRTPQKDSVGVKKLPNASKG